jgi:outer membrane protein
MKRFAVLLFMFLGLTSYSFSQKFAFVDTEYILKNIPAYRSAQENLDKLSATWQKEVETKYAEIDKMYKDYQSEKVLLTDDLKKKKEDDIMNKEKEVKDLQKKYFGKEGELFKKRQELIKPIQDEVYTAVKDVAIEGAYTLIFDTSAGDNIIFFDPKYDKSDAVLEKLGYKK